MFELTVEQLKSLPAGEWVWIVSSFDWNDTYNNGKYVQVDCIDEDELCFVADCQDWAYIEYGKTWFAYRNREFARFRNIDVLYYINNLEIREKRIKYLTVGELIDIDNIESYGYFWSYSDAYAELLRLQRMQLMTI